MSNGVAIRWDLSAIDLLTEHLHRLSAANLEGLKSNIGEYMVGQIQDRFDQQKLVDGTPMPQSKAAKDRNGQTLIMQRLLYKSYVYQTTAAGVELGSDSPYARIHHFGGETGRPGHRFTMEARPVMGDNPADETAIGNMILNELRGLV